MLQQIFLTDVVKGCIKQQNCIFCLWWRSQNWPWIPVVLCSLRSFLAAIDSTPQCWPKAWPWIRSLGAISVPIIITVWKDFISWYSHSLRYLLGGYGFSIFEDIRQPKPSVTLRNVFYFIALHGYRGGINTKYSMWAKRQHSRYWFQSSYSHT